MNNPVYLCGPIAGCTDDECKTWRQLATELCNGNTLDPMRRDYRGREAENINDIVELDKKDIDNSSIVLANCLFPSVGTSMEILYAWERKIPVVAVVPDVGKASPWLIYHSSHVFANFKLAIDYVQAHLSIEIS